MTIYQLLVGVGVLVGMAIIMLILVEGFEKATRPIPKVVSPKHFEYWMQLEDGTIVYPEAQKRIDEHV